MIVLGPNYTLALKQKAMDLAVLIVVAVTPNQDQVPHYPFTAQDLKVCGIHTGQRKFAPKDGRSTVEVGLHPKHGTLY